MLLCKYHVYHATKISVHQLQLIYNNIYTRIHGIHNLFGINGTLESNDYSIEYYQAF